MSSLPNWAGQSVSGAGGVMGCAVDQGLAVGVDDWAVGGVADVHPDRCPVGAGGGVVDLPASGAGSRWR